MAVEWHVKHMWHVKHIDLYIQYVPNNCRLAKKQLNTLPYTDTYTESKWLPIIWCLLPPGDFSVLSSSLPFSHVPIFFHQVSSNVLFVLPFIIFFQVFFYHPLFYSGFLWSTFILTRPCTLPTCYQLFTHLSFVH